MLNLTIFSSFIQSVDLINLAVSLGGTESLIEHPASMTRGAWTGISDEKRRSSGISDGMIRFRYKTDLNIRLQSHRGILYTVFAIRYTYCSPPLNEIPLLPRCITWMLSVAENKSSAYSEYRNSILLCDHSLRAILTFLCYHNYGVTSGTVAPKDISALSSLATKIGQ